MESWLTASVSAQEYRFRFDQVFDNREYFSGYGYAQTIFGAGLDASVLFPVDTFHTVAAGFYYFYENGGPLDGVPPKITLYYHYNRENLEMYFGVFPRNGNLQMARSFLNDTLNYYRPNMEGALVSYRGDHGNVDLFCDWTGRVAEDRRETFLVGLTATLNLGAMYLEPSFLMYHNARDLSGLPQPPLQDNGIMSGHIGYRNQPGEAFLYDISAGLLSSYNRFRPDATVWAAGLNTNFSAQYNIFHLRAVYYVGDPVRFDYGDPFYRSGHYGRADLFVDPFKSKKVSSRLGWSFHYVRGEGIHHSQQILISVSF